LLVIALFLFPFVAIFHFLDAALVVTVVMHLVIVVVMATIHKMANRNFSSIAKKDDTAATLTEDTCAWVHVEIIVIVIIMVGILVEAVMNARSSEFGCGFENSIVSWMIDIVVYHKYQRLLQRNEQGCGESDGKIDRDCFESQDFMQVNDT
jgi:4-hydroxybenzoate polyprenyltransferase